MSKAKRQMLEQSGRASVVRGEAAGDLASDEACGPPLENPDTGSAKQAGGFCQPDFSRSWCTHFEIGSSR